MQNLNSNSKFLKIVLFFGLIATILAQAPPQMTTAGDIVTDGIVILGHPLELFASCVNGFLALDATKKDLTFGYADTGNDKPRIQAEIANTFGNCLRLYGDVEANIMSYWLLVMVS